MAGFEELLERYGPGVERWVKFKVPGADAEDVMQETRLAAFVSFGQLRSPEVFQPWLLGIARKKCADWYRTRARRKEVLMDAVPDRPDDREADETVSELLRALPEKDRLMLRLFYQQDLPQKQIAQRLGIPEGTVKSRLHAARAHVRALYPEKPKGEKRMKALPKMLPAYSIEWKKEAPFPVVWEELMGWFIVPKIGEKLTWGMYDLPSRKLDYAYEMTVTGPARVHGIDGVSIRARAIPPEAPLAEDDPMKEPVSNSGADQEAWTFVAQLADGHTRFLSAEHIEDGVRTLTTFLDGDEFLANWGCGEDNRGNPTRLAAKGLIRREGGAVTVSGGKAAVDIVGRCTLTLDGVPYDTVCVMDVGSYEEDTASEQFLDETGRTLLWRRFNPDDWRFDHYGKRWSEMLPENERLTVNGRVYVHWYDCLCIR